MTATPAWSACVGVSEAKHASSMQIRPASGLIAPPRQRMRCALARAVGSEECVDLAGADREIDAGERDGSAEGLLEARDTDRH